MIAKGELRRFPDHRDEAAARPPFNDTVIVSDRCQMTKHVPGEEVLRFRDHAFHVYFSSPAYLALVERKFGKATVEHIQKMSLHRLQRKFVPA